MGQNDCLGRDVASWLSKQLGGNISWVQRNGETLQTPKGRRRGPGSGNRIQGEQWGMMSWGKTGGRPGQSVCGWIYGAAKLQTDHRCITNCEDIWSCSAEFVAFSLFYLAMVISPYIVDRSWSIQVTAHKTVIWIYENKWHVCISGNSVLHFCLC